MIINNTLGLPVTGWKGGHAPRAFALLGVVAGLTAVSLAASWVVGPANTSTTATVELESQVRSLNAAVEIFQHFGGDLKSATTPAEVIAKIQSSADSLASEKGANGLSGSLIDRQLRPVTLSKAEFESSQPRVVWDKDAGQLVVTTEPIAGVSHFTIEEATVAGFGFANGTPGLGLDATAQANTL